MIAQNSSWTTTIPSTVPNGNYLIRFETIALHSLPAVRIISNALSPIYHEMILMYSSRSNFTPSVLRSVSPVVEPSSLPQTSSSPSLVLTVPLILDVCYHPSFPMNITDTQV